MHVNQEPYHELYGKILSYGGQALFSDVVVPWLESAREEKTWLPDLARRASPENAMEQEENWRLYALSRIVDLLSVGATPGVAAGASGWSIATLTIGEFRTAMEELGLEAIHAPSFHPFFHEVTSVEQAPDPSAPPVVSSEVWPGYRIGRLLLCRARSRVVAGRDHLVKEVAETSCMYWAFARHNRPRSDLSVGWGSNSQWRTSFRLDYEVAGTYFFNHGGKGLLERDDDVLEQDEKLELLRHRCFVRCTKDDSDFWPYDWSAIERPPT
jgi:hypothetical protein